MIDVHNILPLLVFFGSLRVKNEPPEKWRPSNEDTKKLEEGMKSFEMQVLNGKKWYPFELYCRSINIISEGSQGQFIIHNTYEWPHLLATKDLLEWQQDKDQETFFQAYPEEREAREGRMDKLRTEIRAIIGKIAV